MVWTTLASFNAISTVWAIKKATAAQSLKILSYFAPHLNLLLQVLCHCMVWTTLASFNAISTVWAIKKATAAQSLKIA